MMNLSFKKNLVFYHILKSTSLDYYIILNSFSPNHVICIFINYELIVKEAKQASNLEIKHINNPPIPNYDRI